MATFGAYSHFGAAQFGGEPSYLQKYYNALKALDPPGVFINDDSSVRNTLMKVDAKALEIAQLVLDRVEREIFPLTSNDSLTKWEAIYHINPSPKASVTQRQAAVHARWISSLGIDNAGIRQMVYPILNPSTAFYDRCDDEDVSYRYYQLAHNGTISETNTPYRQVLTCASSVNCAWDDDYQFAPTNLYRIHDQSDDFRISVDAYDAATDSNSGCGVCVFQDELNAVCLEVYEGGPPQYMRCWRIYKGVKTLYTGESFTPSINTFNNRWLQIYRQGSTFRFFHGQDFDNMTELATSITATPIKPRYVGIYCQNWNTLPAVNFDIQGFKLQYSSGYNNVEIVDIPAADCPATNPEYKFFAFIHREPTDSGNYNLSEALRLVERIKPARSLIRVGHEDCFKCDDAYSLCDRDILGQ